MQSFLQYRSIGRSVQQQLQRKEKGYTGADPEKDVEAQRGGRQNGLSGLSSATRVASDAGVEDNAGNGDIPELEDTSAKKPEQERMQRWRHHVEDKNIHPQNPEPAAPAPGPDSDRVATLDHAKSGGNGGSLAADRQQEEEEEEGEEYEAQEEDVTDTQRRQELERVPTAQAGNLEGSHSRSTTGGRPGAPTRSSTQRSRRSMGTRLGVALTGIAVRDRTTKEGGGDEQVFVVGWEGEDDPLNPHNWPRWRRWYVTVLVALIGAVVGIASSIDSSALARASREFGVSEVVESLATGIYLMGFGCGALFAGPISETVGRNPVYVVTLTLYMIFVMASGLSPNIGAQLAFRFLAGFFGATPLTCAGGSVSDIWSPLERVYAFPVFANAAFLGPLLGPVMGGFIAGSYLNWRWTEWITLIISGAVLALVALTQPETYAGVLLSWRAAHLRSLTSDNRYVSPMEVRQETFFRRLKRALYRPFILTASEPIILFVALYLTVIYIVLFTFLEGYTYIFADIHGTNDGITGLCFVGIIIGLFGATALVPLIYKWAQRDTEKLRKQLEAEGKDPSDAKLPPEFRLWFSMLGGSVAIPVSLFWMGWTSDSNISIWSPLAASVLFGYGILCVFISSYQYIIDSYETYAASGLASVTLIRYVASGGMVVVAIPFYENEGVHYTLTIMACISALLAPIPYVFYKYGHKLREKSKYAVAFKT